MKFSFYNLQFLSCLCVAKAVYNPWRADLFTAFKSTNIKNIATYSEFPGFVVSMMKGRFLWLRNLVLNRLISFVPEGPTTKQLQKGSTFIKVFTENARGEKGTVEIKGPEAYLFTAISLEKMLRLLDENTTLKGCMTPSMLGTDWIKTMEGIEVKIENK